MTGFSEQLEVNSEKYLTHFGKTAVALKAICDEAGIPLDASGVNAVAFTVYKSTKDSFGHLPTRATESAVESSEAPKAAPAKAASGEKGRILKLENAGDEAYIVIASADKVQGNFGAQYEFTGAVQPNGENIRLFIGEAAVERQLQFLGLQAPDLIGKTVQFSRAPNPKGRPFWNISVKGAMKGGVKKSAAKTFEEPPTQDDDGSSFPF